MKISGLFAIFLWKKTPTTARKRSIGPWMLVPVELWSERLNLVSGGAHSALEPFSTGCNNQLGLKCATNAEATTMWQVSTSFVA